MAYKTITMHPINATNPDAIDPTVDLFPKTLASNLLEDDGSTTKVFQDPIAVYDGTPNNDFLILTNNSEIVLQINELRKDMIKSVYPIGSIYMSTDGTITDPNEALDPQGALGLAGEITWEQISGVFLIASGTNTDDDGTQYTFDSGDTGGRIASHVVEHTHNVSAYNGSLTGSHTATGKAYFHALSDNEHIWNTSGVFSNSSDATQLDANTATVNKTKHWASLLQFDLTHAHTINLPSKETALPSNGIAITADNQHNLPPYLAVKMWKRTA